MLWLRACAQQRSASRQSRAHKPEPSLIHRALVGHG